MILIWQDSNCLPQSPLFLTKAEGKLLVGGEPITSLDEEQDNNVIKMINFAIGMDLRGHGPGSSFPRSRILNVKSQLFYLQLTTEN